MFEEEEPGKQQEKQIAVTYSSKLVNNQTNHFVTKYDPISK